MHVCDAGDCQAGAAEDLGKPMCRMKCGRCGAETDWMIFDTVTDAKRGIPCASCNVEKGFVMTERYEKSAVLSDCGQYRYHLARKWSDDKPMLFVMLNPSTADHREDDNTIRRCVGFATRNGCGSIQVVNLFAFRTTYPPELKRAGYPSGPENLEMIRRTAQAVAAAGGLVVCAWGSNARGLAMVATVKDVLRDVGVRLYALKLLGDGTPAHPLMLANDCQLLEVPNV
ncbi:DUF1643 domain-containing protein [Cupriavidus pauculus]|uniref:DUF1643 domain-containing protein n=1 Tax=Cupriavidus pauculus TaxID=82633 RepID=UPI001D0C16F1|nr:DUF1643 domain-containing protein [Cupriavidus pauculus]